MNESTKTLEQVLSELAAPLHPRQIKQKPGPKGKMFDFVTQRDVIYRFNAVCSAIGWSSSFESEHNPTGDGAVYIKCTISVTVGGVTVSHTGAGQAPKTDKEPYKNAHSDAMKRAAVMFGFAAECYHDHNWELGDDQTQQAIPNYPEQQYSAPTPRPQDAQTTPNNADEAHALIDNALTIARGNKKLASPTEWVELSAADRKRIHATIGDLFADNEERYTFATLIGFPASTKKMDRAQRSTFAQIAGRRDAKKIVKLIINDGQLFAE